MASEGLSAHVPQTLANMKDKKSAHLVENDDQILGADLTHNLTMTQ